MSVFNPLDACEKHYPISDPGERKRSIDQDICPQCGGELDTGFECNDCQHDAKDSAYTELDKQRVKNDQS